MNGTIEELAELAGKIGGIMKEMQIPYFLTGGVVSSFYGEQRSTQDVDVVISLANTKKEDVDKLFQELQKQFMVSRSAFDEAISRNRMFQALDIKTMLRADINVGGMSFDRFDKIIEEEIFPNVFVSIASPEDSILSKLIWIKKGSGRSKQDVVAMLKIQTKLDWEYLSGMAKQLAVQNILEEMKQIADRNDPQEIY
jgi:hypothetical protein